MTKSSPLLKFWTSKENTRRNSLIGISEKKREFTLFDHLCRANVIQNKLNEAHQIRKKSFYKRLPEKLIEELNDDIRKWVSLLPVIYKYSPNTTGHLRSYATTTGPI
jgi:hypothetical protein